MAWSKEDTDRALAEIIRRAQRDPAYRALCLQNPAAAVKAVSPEPLPPGFTLRFVDNARADLTVVLPDPIAAGSGQELSDAELSAVSGGILSPDAQIQKKVVTDKINPQIPGACFAAGTPVLMADGSWRPIETISAGAAVLAFDEGTRRIVATRVSELLDHRPESIYRAVVEGVDRELLVTPNHPFYSGDRWQRIGNLPAQSELFFFDSARGESSPRRLLAFERTGRSAPVYNFEVEEAHSYFVDGVLVHNGKALGK
jgi:hypothetical protein